MESKAAEPAPGMLHLRAARIDLDGQAVATGTIQYPPDDGGVFPLPAHDCLSLRIDAMDGELSAVRARLVRGCVHDWLGGPDRSFLGDRGAVAPPISGPAGRRGGLKQAGRD